MHPVIFAWDGINRVFLKIKRPKVRPDVLARKEKPSAEERKELDAYDRLVAANRGSSAILFTGRGTPTKPYSTFTTSNPDLVRYIRANKAGRKIREDLSLMPVRCPYCEFMTDGNTSADQEALALHIASEHADVTDANDAS